MKQEKNWAFPVFLILIVLFIIVNMISTAPMWNNLFASSGLLNTGIHSILTLGAGPNDNALRWSNIPWYIGSAFPGIILALFPLLSIVFSKKRKKVLARIFAIANLLIGLYCTMVAWSYGWPFGVCWLLYLCAGIMVLLYVLDTKLSKKMFAITFVTLGIIGVLAYILLACSSIDVYRSREVQFHGLGFAKGLFSENPFTRLSNYGYFGSGSQCNAASFYSPGHALIFFALACGVLPWAVPKKLTRKDASQIQGYEIQSSKEAGAKGEIVMESKSKIVAALLAFFLSMTGAHRYYLGWKKQGVMQTCGLIALGVGWGLYIPAMMEQNIVLMLFSALLLLYGLAIAIWTFVDFIRILTGGLKPYDGSDYTENRPAQVQMIQPEIAAKGNLDVLEKLANLHQQGILTDEEFQQKKTDILAKM